MEFHHLWVLGMVELPFGLVLTMIRGSVDPKLLVKKCGVIEGWVDPPSFGDDVLDVEL